jgi:hypothetical protein
MRRTLFLALLGLTACFQTYNEDDGEIRTVPVTNNPNVVPNVGGGGGFPMMGGS